MIDLTIAYSDSRTPIPVGKAFKYAENGLSFKNSSEVVKGFIASKSKFVSFSESNNVISCPL